jgi:hypothetical protein
MELDIVDIATESEDMAQHTRHVVTMAALPTTTAMGITLELRSTTQLRPLVALTPGLRLTITVTRT